MQTLSPRQQSVLNRVIDTHIETAEPVGSHYITHIYSQRYNGTYSSATVRHEMGLLEEYGYLTHPHPSAGRVPTDRGYRYYIDHSLTPESFSGEDFEQLHDRMEEFGSSVDLACERASEVLSRLSEEVSLLLIPEIKGSQPYKLYICGSSLMLRKPEFQEIEKIRKIFELFEQKTALIHSLVSRLEEGIQVTIGRENDAEAFQDCAVVSSRFYVKRRGRPGVIALIGPKRMRYGRALPLVQKIASAMERIADSSPDPS